MQFPEIRQNKLQKFLHGIAMSKVGIACLSKTGHVLDRGLLALSGGRFTLFGLFGGALVVTVGMRGAKSGLPRSLPLVAIPQGQDLLLIASNWGQARNPGWYYNLRANPCATITYRGQSEEYTVRELKGAEREQAFALAYTVYRGYRLYRQTAAPREIPVLRLSPS
jgi:deazaflavin-dependent oxidoreductase (nitroreductase family)